MKEWISLGNQRKAFLLRSPGAPTFLVSVFLHLATLVLVVVLQRLTPTHVSPKTYELVQVASGPAHISLNSKPAQSSVRPNRAILRPRPTRVTKSGGEPNGTASQALRQQAEKATAAITMSLKFRGIYGFYPGPDYKLAVQTSGEVPVISADQLPPHFQQYLIVEVTIDTEGKVAEAKIVAGMVDSGIEQMLLSAIRDFKYIPAKRDGVPIPSQRDIVIHIPT